MEDKAARFTILIDADRKKAFDELCASQDVTASQIIRQLIHQYMVDHGVHEGSLAPRGKKASRPDWRGSPTDE
jgi:hypothetical protein